MSRIDQVNHLLLVELGQLINQEIQFENGLITISYVDCSKDLKTAKVAVSVFPDYLYGTALNILRKKNKIFTKNLQRKLKMKFIPKIKWIIDSTEKEAAELEQVFQEAGNSDN